MTPGGRGRHEGTLTATNGPAGGLTSTDVGVREAGSELAGQSLARTYDAAADVLVWSGPAPATPGAVDGGPVTGPGPDPDPEPVAVCDVAPTHEIGAVQGSATATPLARTEVVTVRGVVVGDVEGFRGFYLQDPDGDGDAATSDGVFVVSPVAVGLGDTVAVTGTPGEFGGDADHLLDRRRGLPRRHRGGPAGAGAAGPAGRRRHA